jgi:SecD/SecF fusion protein
MLLHIKLKFSIGIILLLATVMTSCTTANHEVEVGVDMSRIVLYRARNPKDVDFLKVYHAAHEGLKNKSGNYIELFFKKADKLFPSRKYISFFKFNSKLPVNASNKEVKEYFLARREHISERIITVLSSRLERFGVASAELVEGQDHIRIGISTSADDAIISRLIMSTAKVEFLELYKMEAIYRVWGQVLVLSQPKQEVVAEVDSIYNEDGEYEEVVQLSEYSQPEPGVMGHVRLIENELRVEAQYKNAVHAFLISEEVKAILPENLKFKWSSKPEKDNRGNPGGFILYPCKMPEKGSSRVDQYDIKSATADFNDEYGNHFVTIEMTQNGSQEWAQFTSVNVGNRIAICLNEIVYSAPMINQSISGGTTEISGSFTESEAEDLAGLLSIGNLPVPCFFISIKNL